MNEFKFREEGTYDAPKCSYCRKSFENGETYYYNSINLLKRSGGRFWFCIECKPFIENFPDFNAIGSTKLCPAPWAVMRQLILWRDEGNCRICYKYYNIIGDKKIWNEIHHITPKKDGGTNHPSNLITLCERHHNETYKNNYGGLVITDRLIQLGIQKRLSFKER